MISGAVKRFWHDDRGAVTIDFLPVFFFLVFIVLMIFEIGLAFYLNLASQKAAQLGARSAVTRSPVHAGVPDTNILHYAAGSHGDACYQDNAASACLDPGGPWVCNGAALDGQCNAATFNAIIADMRRADPNLDASRVTISYIYRQLGYAGGPFVPEVRVDLPAGRFGLFGEILGTHFRNDQWADNPEYSVGIASASAFGEDLNSVD